MSFKNLGLTPPLLKALVSQGYAEATPIQIEAIPAILAGRDVMAMAQTGTGKTAGFALPILQKLSQGTPARSNQARALVLTPTRELAAQVAESFATYGQHLSLRSTVVYGGVKINPQMLKLRRGVDVLVATPGRLLDLHAQNAVSFDQLEVLVLDEADRMLDMGFIHDIKRIILSLPRRRQNLMFSATFSNEIRDLAKKLVRSPIEISVTSGTGAATSVKHWICPVEKKRKAPLLVHLIHDRGWQQVLVFAKTKHGANKLTKFLEAEGITAAAIHGNKSQAARNRALADFKAGELRILVATDIAARGLDIAQLPQVVNFDLPNVPQDYIHRIGRTGRGGFSGEAISLVSADEVDLLSDIERLMKQLLTRVEIDGFEPEQRVPETTLARKTKSAKPRKPLSSQTPGDSYGRSSKRKAGASPYGHGPQPGEKRKSGTSGALKGSQKTQQKQTPSEGKARDQSSPTEAAARNADQRVSNRRPRASGERGGGGTGRVRRTQ